MRRNSSLADDPQARRARNARGLALISAASRSGSCGLPAPRPAPDSRCGIAQRLSGTGEGGCCDELGRCEHVRELRIVAATPFRRNDGRKRIRTDRPRRARHQCSRSVQTLSLLGRTATVAACHGLQVLRRQRWHGRRDVVCTRAPNTTASSKEFDARRFAPCAPVRLRRKPIGRRRCCVPGRRPECRPCDNAPPAMRIHSCVGSIPADRQISRPWETARRGQDRSGGSRETPRSRLRDKRHATTSRGQAPASSCTARMKRSPLPLISSAPAPHLRSRAAPGRVQYRSP